MINITLNGNNYEISNPITIKELLDEYKIEGYKIAVAAIEDGEILRLNKNIKEDKNIKIITRAQEMGNRIYRRSLFMLLAKAVYDVDPECKLSIEHSLSNGIYCELKKGCPLNQFEVKKIKSKMDEYVKKDFKIKKHHFSKNEVKKIYEKQDFQERLKNLEYLEKEKFVLYEIDGYYDYFYHEMVPSTSYLELFDLHYRLPGFILMYPRPENPEVVPEFINQPKLANVFLEYERLGDILNVATASELNKKIIEEDYNELIRIAEGLHEKKIAQIADEINNNINNKKIILIAGPSSSGKTTFSHRLGTQLKINGLNPITISTDNYFVDRENTPLDENGNYDFEALEAIDLELFNNHLLKLLQGEEVEIPNFNFEKGEREFNGDYIKLDKRQPILIEGIHGLNDKLTTVIPQNHKYKIYVSALTQLNLDSHNRFPTSDIRLLRRIVRDSLYRGHSASDTIRWWPNVRKGEENNIFPYQGNADVMFNSALIYEMGILKKYAYNLLNEIEKDDDGYLEAQRLIEILEYFKVIPEPDIPSTSIIKEFIGGSAFREN
ncbi:MAG TPA: nucleoside kinase [Halanaerobiales bacterium]|nr:nucleoside kinase [Halanaerobiales bacterium]